MADMPAPDLMVKALRQLDCRHAGPADPQPDDGVTYAAKIDKDQRRISTGTGRRPKVLRHVHGLSPFPGSWTDIGGERIKILASRTVEGQGPPGEVLNDRLHVACSEGAVELLRLQRAGKGAQDKETFLRGWSIPVGTRLAME